MKIVIWKYATLIIIVSGYYILPNFSLAQVFTFDYLSYSDPALIPHKSRTYSPTAFLFIATGEFDAFGKSEQNNISYKEFHIHFAFAFNFMERIQFSVIPQWSALLAKGTSARSYGNIWFLGKYMFLKGFPLTFRVSFKLGKIGKSYWLKQNDFDIGLLWSKSFSSIGFDGTLSYRIRGKSSFDLTDFTARFNQPGNTFHYKIDLSNRVSEKSELSFFLLGYISGNKKLDGKLLVNSNSHKTTIGAALKIRSTNIRSYKLGALLDVIGKHDKKGFAIVFSSMH